MNQKEMVEKMAEIADIPKTKADVYIKILLGIVEDELAQAVSDGDLSRKVSIPGFGIFSVSHRKARTGRNPQTGEPVEIQESFVPTFRAGKGFKSKLN